MPIVLKHGDKYKTCICDGCKAEIGYLESESETMATPYPIDYKEYIKSRKSAKQKDVLYLYSYISCPECQGTIFLDYKLLEGREADMYRKYGR